MICSYLWEYNQYSHQESQYNPYTSPQEALKFRQQIQQLFSKYPVMSCWAKMCRQMKAWLALGLIMQLASITKETMEMAASKWIPPNGVNIIPDESLAKYLHVYSLKNLQYLMSFCLAVPMPSLDKLQYIAEEKGVYCKETIYDFHCFCV